MKVAFNDKKEMLHEALGISDERREHLFFRAELIMHDFLRPTKDEYLPPTFDILKLHIALAENPQELVLLTFWAAISMKNVVDAAECDEIEDEQ